MLECDHIQLGVGAAQLGFHGVTHFWGVEHALIRRLGFVIVFLEAAAVAFGFNEFGHGQKVVEIEAIDWVERIEGRDLFGRVIAPISHQAAYDRPILFFDKGIIILAPDAPPRKRDFFGLAITFQIRAFAIRTK